MAVPIIPSVGCSTTNEIIDHVELVTRIKKDPLCHEDNFISQYNHFERLCQLLALEPSSMNENLIQLISFISTVIHNYKAYVPKFVNSLVSLIENYGQQLESTIRLVMCKVLLKQQRQNSIEPLKLYQILLGLFNCKDKTLRKSLQHLIISNIKNSNRKHYNNQVNLSIQGYFFKLLQQTPLNNDDTNNDNNEPVVLAILNIVISLWKKRMWTNEKTINMISYVCFSSSYKVSFTAIKFFLAINNTTDTKGADDESDNEFDNSTGDDIKKVNAMMLIKANKSDTKPTISRTSRKRKRKLDKALEYMSNIERKKRACLSEQSLGDSSAIRLLNDPQSFCVDLLKKFSKSKNRFELKLMIIELVARVISVHTLIIPHYYTIVQRYLRPHQQNAVRILTALVQSCHKLVPDEYLCACIKTIAANFISQHSASEIAAVGMNTIREICWRSPFAIEESLAQELVSMEKGINGSKGIDKVLAIASKSLLQTLRVVNPKVLLRKDRARPLLPKAQQQLLESLNKTDDPLSVMAAPQTHTTIPGLEYFDNDGENSAMLPSSAHESESEDATDIDEDDSCCSDQQHSFDSDGVDCASNNQNQPLNSDAMCSRFLTDEEFKMIRRNKMKHESKMLAESLGNKKHKTANNTDHENSSDVEDHSIIHHDDIIGVEKVGFVSGLRKKHTNPELISSTAASRATVRKTPDLRKQANAEYRSKVFNDWRFNPKASKTQREKNKSKPFMMIRHKRQVKGKAKKSIRQKIATLRKTIKNAGKIRH